MGQGLLNIEDSWSHSIRHTTLSRIPLDEWSDRRRDLYLTTHNIQNRQTSIPPAEVEPTIPESERLQTHALDRAATGIAHKCRIVTLNNVRLNQSTCTAWSTRVTGAYSRITFRLWVAYGWSFLWKEHHKKKFNDAVEVLKTLFSFSFLREISDKKGRLDYKTESLFCNCIT